LIALAAAEIARVPFQLRAWRPRTKPGQAASKTQPKAACEYEEATAEHLLIDRDLLARRRAEKGVADEDSHHLALTGRLLRHAGLRLG
jgi:hypothetical protein